MGKKSERKIVKVKTLKYSLDKVLKGVSIRPLLSERRSMSHCGEVTQSKPVLHAFVPARHLLLFGLEERQTEVNLILWIPHGLNEGF